MHKIKIATILFIFLLVNIAVLTPSKANEMQGLLLPETTKETASLSILPDKSSFLNPDYLILDIIVESGDQLINAVNIELSFSTSTISLVDINTEQSFCSFFLREEYNNVVGNINFACGTSAKDVNQSASIARLVFAKKNEGWATIKFHENSAVLASDGLGTDVLGSREIHNLYIMK